MGAIGPGYTPLVAESSARTGIATERCTECTLMRCYAPGCQCWECKQQVTEPLSICPHDGSLYPTGGRCEVCASTPG